MNNFAPRQLFVLALLAAVLGGPCAEMACGAIGDFVPAPARVRTVIARGKAIPMDSLGDRKVTIDGDLSDWGDLTDDGITIDEVLDHTEGADSPARSDAAVFKLLRGPDAIYLAVAVADPSRAVAGPNNAYAGDAVELFFDVRPVEPAAGPKLGDQAYSDGGVYQLIFTAPEANSQPVVWKQYTGSGPKFGPINVAGRNEKWGYTLEMRIPFSSMAGSSALRFAEPFGMDVYVDNLDDNMGHSVYAWGGFQNDWMNADQFGLVIPGYQRELSQPLFRTVPGKFTPPPFPRITLGAISSRGSSVPESWVKLTLRKLSATRGGLDRKLELGPVTKIDHPELGFSVMRWSANVDELSAGNYELSTQIAGVPLVGDTQSFQTLSYRIDPTAGQLADAKAGSKPDRQVAGRYILPNGWAISPAGTQIPLKGDMPMRLVFSPDGKYLFVNTAGFNQQGISAIDLATNKIVDNIDLKHAWYGMAMAQGPTRLIVSGGGAHASKDLFANGTVPGSSSTFPVQYECKGALDQVGWSDGKFTQMDSISLPGGDSDMAFVAGVAVDHEGTIYAVDTDADAVFRISYALISVMAGAVPPYQVDSNKVYYRPYAIAISPDGKTIAVSNWGDGSVSFMDKATFKVKSNLAVGSHPNDLAYAPDGRLFVANGGSNSVSVIANGTVAETITTSLDPKAPIGSTPDALAITPGGKCLYVANADNNDIAVVDISNPDESAVRGFIPTGWYPSALAVSADGSKIYVGVGKGLHFGNNAGGQYIGTVLNGAVSVVPAPTPAQLAAYTRQVIANTPLPKTTPASTTQKAVAGAFKKIKHVVYIIRENRTYDQVLGDMNRGDGAPSLTMFGKEVTPNAHFLASHFVLLDNLFCNGEVSEDGHEWCNAAYATDFKERAWVGSYSGRGEADADDRLSASPAGYLWDNCAAHGLTYISYGEYGGYNSSPNHPPTFWGVHGLVGHASKTYSQIPWGKVHDTARADVFIADLHAAEKTGKWPAYMVMSLGEDHTQGLNAGAYTPVAAVAANDQALGMIVDAVSHSRFWKETAIFIIEDDAQNGQDHVDAHRTVGLLVSPYVKRNTVDSTFYTTSSFVHTMEWILGLPVMTQFDANAAPMYNAFTPTPDFSPFGRVKPLVNIDARNGDKTPGALLSAKLDFSAPDRADPDTLNRILWQALKPGLPMPAPVRSALLPRR